MWAFGAVAVALSAPPCSDRFVERPRITHSLDDRGGGLLDLSATIEQGDGGETWKRCSPGRACEPVQADPEGFGIEVGDPPAGTRFVATIRGHEVSSREWQGQVQLVRGARLEGTPQVGELIRPVAAQWTGGWGGEADHLQVQSCRTRGSFSGCVGLIDNQAGHCRDGAGGARRVPPKAVGRWLRVVDRRFSPEPPTISIGIGFPEREPPINGARSPLVSIAWYGPVRPGRPRRGKCPGGTRPTVIPTTSLRDVAIVHCPLRCTVDWSVRQGSRTLVTKRLRLDEEHSVPLVLSKADRRRFEPGEATLTVRVDGRHIKTATLRFRRPRK